MKTDVRTDVLAEYNNAVAPALARIGIALVNYVATAGSQSRGNSLFTCSADALQLRSQELARSVERLIALGSSH
ncbi:MAG TPA: hypothetical protein VF292_14085 [Rhodanobacteraceae bacterium]